MVIKKIDKKNGSSERKMKGSHGTRKKLRKKEEKQRINKTNAGSEKEKGDQEK